MRRVVLVLALVCGAASLQAQNQGSQRELEKEYALGAWMAVQVRDSTIPLNLAGVTNYVQSLGQELASQMPGPSRAWSFTVIRDDKGGPTHEPVTLPGGYIFISAELILAAENGAEFAGMLAHSIAHVVNRDGIDKGSQSGYAARPVIVHLAGVQREQELRADNLAVQAMSRAGYDPHALLNYIERAQPADHGTGSFSPLPPRSVRLANLEQAIQSIQALGSRHSGASFLSIREEVRLQLAPAPTSREVRQIPSLINASR